MDKTPTPSISTVTSPPALIGGVVPEVPVHNISPGSRVTYLLMNDMATLTGGQVVDKDKGMKLDKFDLNWLGECRTVTVTKEQTTIVDGAGEECNYILLNDFI